VVDLSVVTEQTEIINGYVLHEAFSRSRFATVFTVTEGSSGQLCAAKRIFNDVTFLQWRAEESHEVIAMLLSLQHPNVTAVRYVVYDQSLPHIFVMMQYAPLGPAGKVDGDGYCYPQRHPRKLLIMLRSALAGLCYLHHRGIAHGGIKPENLLLCGDDSHVALTDVIMSRLGCQPSPFFAAPETKRFTKAQPPTLEADIWALGVTFYALLVGRVPTAVVSTGENLQALPANTPPALRTALTSMLIWDVKSRFTAQQLAVCVQGAQPPPLKRQPLSPSPSSSSESSLSPPPRRTVSFAC
jgi:serine/threonine protein kinase